MYRCLTLGFQGPDYWVFKVSGAVTIRSLDRVTNKQRLAIGWIVGFRVGSMGSWVWGLGMLGLGSYSIEHLCWPGQ